MSRESKKINLGELPYQVSQGMHSRHSGKHGVAASQGETWGTVVRAAQGNFDYLMGIIRDIVESHNSLVDDFAELAEAVAQLENQ